MSVVHLPKNKELYNLIVGRTLNDLGGDYFVSFGTKNPAMDLPLIKNGLIGGLTGEGILKMMSVRVYWICMYNDNIDILLACCVIWGVVFGLPWIGYLLFLLITKISDKHDEKAQ